MKSGMGLQRGLKIPGEAVGNLWPPFFALRARNWWLASTNPSNANNERNVNPSGALNNNNANNVSGVAPRL